MKIAKKKKKILKNTAKSIKFKLKYDRRTSRNAIRVLDNFFHKHSQKEKYQNNYNYFS